MKTLSFIIPAYNSENFLRKCVNSMLVPEALSKLEVIIVNDGSTDQTEKIAQEFCTNYPDTIFLISQENKGHGGALNTGCAAATGKYLKVVDADDWVDTQNLTSFLTFLEGCQSDVVLTHYRTIDIGTGQIRNWKSYPDAFGMAYSFDRILSNWSSFERALTFHGIAYRTSFYREKGIQLSEHVFYEDYEFATFPCCHGESITCFDLFLYDYRIGDVNQSVSDASRLNRLGHMETVIDRLTTEYQELPNSSGKRYAAVKLQELLLSYLTTVLLTDPDRRRGRMRAKRIMETCRRETPEVFAMAGKKYGVFYLMNLLHLSRKDWNRVLNSRAYRLLRRKHSFD